MQEITAERLEQMTAEDLTWISGPWRTDACEGYALLAMERMGMDAETIWKFRMFLCEVMKYVDIEDAVDRSRRE